MVYLDGDDDSFEEAYQEYRAAYYERDALYKNLRSTITPGKSERDEILLDPYGWHAYRLASMPKDPRHVYFVTFTRNEQISVEKWLSRVQYELSRTFVVTFKGGIEHPLDNIHVHCVLRTDKYIDKQKFKTFINHYGWIDFQVAKQKLAAEMYSTKDDLCFDTIDMFKQKAQAVLLMRDLPNEN